MENTLFLRLESPLQSWGDSSQWSERRTAPEPTKSGIVGLLACALGWADDERIRDLSQKIRVGVRADLPGTPAPLIDYHTVGGGYPKHHAQLLQADGKPKFIPGTKIPHTEPTWRYYLCDASFLAAIQPRGIDHLTLIAELTEAVQNPVWPLYLGRKSCPPARPIYDALGDYTTLEEALENHPARFTEEKQITHVKKHPRIIVECTPLQGVRRRNQLASRTYWLHEPTYSREYLSPNEIRIETLHVGG